MSINLAQALPTFSMLATNAEQIELSTLRGKHVVLYFYPKDSTPGCTQQAQNFRDLHAEFIKLNTVIFGVSRDPLAAHEKFKSAQGLPFELLVDTEQKLCAHFDVIKEKQMYGKLVRGIERSTFLIDEHGVLIRAWRRVKVSGHATAVLEAVRALAH